MKLHSETYDSYKNAEGEWSETIPSEWQEKRVKDLFRLVTDAAPADNDYELLSLYAGIGVKPRKDLEARGNKASSTDGYWIVRKNDIVVNKLLAWMGSVGLSEYDGVTSPAYDVLRQVSKDIDPRYFAYLFRTETAKKIFRKNSRGIMDMRLRLYFDKLGAITTPVPPYKTQIAISKYIDRQVALIDEKKIILNKKLDLLELLKERVIFNAVNEANIGDKNWNEIRLKDILTIKSGNTGIQKTDDGEFPIYGANGVIGMAHHFEQDQDKILIGRVGSCGEVTLATGKYVVSDNALIVTTKNRVSQSYLYYKLCSLSLGNLANKNAQPLLTGTAIKNIITSIPDYDEQILISTKLKAKCSEIYNFIELVKLKIEKLGELRIALINDALTGRVKCDLYMDEVAA